MYIWLTKYIKLSSKKVEMSKMSNQTIKNLEKEKTTFRKRINDVGSIFNDFKKTKQECSKLSQEMGVEFHNATIFETLQKQTNQKYESVGNDGLKELKGKLLKSSSQMTNFCNELKTHKEKKSSFKEPQKVQLEKLNFTKKNSNVSNEPKFYKQRLTDRKQSQKVQSSNFSNKEPKFQKQRLTDRKQPQKVQILKFSKQLSNHGNEPKLQKQRMTDRKKSQKTEQQKVSSECEIGSKLSKNIILQQLKRRQRMHEKEEQNQSESSLKIPFYYIKQGNAQTKIDRITKFVAFLKKNIKEQIKPFENEGFKDILYEDPLYLKIREQLERYKMLVEQLLTKIMLAEVKAVEDFLKAAEIVQQNQNYIILKILKFQQPQLQQTLPSPTKTSPPPKQPLHQNDQLAQRKMKLAKISQEIHELQLRRQQQQHLTNQQEEQSSEDEQDEQDGAKAGSEDSGESKTIPEIKQLKMANISEKKRKLSEKFHQIWEDNQYD